MRGEGHRGKVLQSLLGRLCAVLRSKRKNYRARTTTVDNENRHSRLRREYENPEANVARVPAVAVEFARPGGTPANTL